jgi:hypothetical protein
MHFTKQIVGVDRYDYPDCGLVGIQRDGTTVGDSTLYIEFTVTVTVNANCNPVIQ